MSRKTTRFKGADDAFRQKVFKNILSDRGIERIEFRPQSGRGKPRIAYVAAEFCDLPQ